MLLTTAYRLEQEANKYARARDKILAQDPGTAEHAANSLPPRQRFERLAGGVGMLGLKNLATMPGWSVTDTFILGLSTDERRPVYARFFLRQGELAAVAAHWLRTSFAPYPVDHQEMVMGPPGGSTIGAEYAELVQLDPTAGPLYEPRHSIERAQTQLSLLEGTLITVQGAAGTALRPAS